MTPDQIAALYLFALCIWREARGEDLNVKVAQAWTVRNRVENPSWWGKDWISVITYPEQYSGFNPGDINSRKWPRPGDSSWSDCWNVALAVYNESLSDPTGGSTNYFDQSLDSNPPEWATDGSYEHVFSIGRLRFYRLVKHVPQSSH